MVANQITNSVLLSEIRVLLNKVIRQNLAEGILFSAGTDTSIIAYEALKYKPDLKAFTMVFKQGQPKDMEFVKRMVSFLKLDHEFQEFDIPDVISAAHKVVSILNTFDPMEVRHAIPVYIGLMTAKKKGLKSVFTGDGLDELFGYPWLFHLTQPEFVKSLNDMWEEMFFSSVPLGKSIGIAVKTPYLDVSFMDYVKGLPIKLKINFERGTKYGKWLLRKAYEDLIPCEVIWRAKTALEKGTGTEVLKTIFSAKISDEEFEEKKRNCLATDDVQIVDKEQMFYYEVFRRHCGRPAEVFMDKRGKQCQKCKGYVKTTIGFCRICGNYPI